MFVKICAHTNLADALLSVEAGADALGFVFAKSTRQVTAAQVSVITRALPVEVKKIGVFYSLDFDDIAEHVQRAGLTGVQLHGGYSPHLIAALRDRFGDDLFLIQTTHWRVGDPNHAQRTEAFRNELAQLRDVEAIDAVLVDSRTAVGDGGTGVAFDWQAAKRELAHLGTKNLIVAGGLTAENVGEAIRVLQPWGVDVASGTEFMPGMKDAGKIRAFVAAARSAKK